MISTSRLLLRPFLLADVPKVFAMSLEAGIGRWMPDQVYRDEAHAEEVVRALMAFTADAPDPKVRPYVLGIEERATGDVIGHVGLSAARGSVEIGYAIEDRRCGHGLATEAVRAMSEWGLGALSLPEVLGIVEAENAPSRRVLEKAGFVIDREEVKLVAGRSRTNVIYRRLLVVNA
jgi:[ribosomal protein S5]-alanine N-acetyltransferase